MVSHGVKPEDELGKRRGALGCAKRKKEIKNDSLFKKKEANVTIL